MALNLEEEKKNEFDFETWINEYKLNDIKQCFIKYEMYTLNSLNMDNENYMKLIRDNKITSNPHLFVNITKAMLSLNKLRDSEHKKITILPQAENEQFMKIQNCIKQLNKRQYKLKSTIQQKLENKIQKNNIFIDQYENNNKLKLDEIRDKIKQTFKNLENECKTNEDTLKAKVETERNKIKLIAQKYEEKKKNIENIFSECLSIIQQNKGTFKDSMKKCEDIINKYHEDDRNKKRETEIINVGIDATDHDKKVKIVLNDKCLQIIKFLNSNLNLPTFIHISNINNTVYHRICENLNSLIEIVDGNDDEKNEMDDTSICCKTQQSQSKYQTESKPVNNPNDAKNNDLKHLPTLNQSFSDYTDYIALQSKSSSKSPSQGGISQYSAKSIEAFDSDSQGEQKKYLCSFPQIKNIKPLLYYYHTFDSSILSDDERDTFLEKLYENNIKFGENTWELIYHGKRDGLSSMCCRDRCDQKQNLLCFIHTTTNHVIGGYTSNGWKSGSAIFNADDEAFIFVIRSPNNETVPIIATIKPEEIDNAVYSYDGHYLVFGSDYCICVNDQGNVYIQSNPDSYQVISKEQQFIKEIIMTRVVDVEVFQVFQLS